MVDLRSRGDHQCLAADRAAIRPHPSHSAARGIEPQHGGLLHHAPAVILQGPGVCLHRALRIGVAAEMMQIPARDVLACQRHQLADLSRVKLFRHKTLPHRVLPRIAVALHLFCVHRDANALAAELGRVAKQLIHHRPQALLLAKERTEWMCASATVASRRLPADDSLVDHQDIDALASEPPSGG